tara:strand:+ start:53 stop:2365 length:2313 start_codon:yes stop_codon:yes gene_type:complete
MRFPRPSKKDADARTEKIAQLLPEEWKSDSITTKDVNQDDLWKTSHKPLLDEVTRAVPLGLLLDHTPEGLHDKYDKKLLETSHFFLSTPVKKFTAFVSHRWSTAPRQVVTALLVHVWLAGGRLAFFIFGICITLVAMFYIYPPLTLVVLPFLAYAIIGFLTLTHKSPRMLRIMGYGQPDLWFDKTTVHQTKSPLTQVGLSLFGHFMELSDHFLILFQPAYLTRVWTMYELAYWLKHIKQGDSKITLVPINTYNSLLRLALTYFPLVWCLVSTIMSALIFLILLFLVVNVDSGADGAIWFIIVTVLVATVVITACFGYCFDARILKSAKKERLAVGEQLKNFDVKLTAAFEPKDKRYVLGEICKWWGTDGKEYAKALDTLNEHLSTDEGYIAALDAFNTFVSTDEGYAKALDALHKHLSTDEEYVEALNALNTFVSTDEEYAAPLAAFNKFVSRDEGYTAALDAFNKFVRKNQGKRHAVALDTFNRFVRTDKGYIAALDTFNEFVRTDEGYAADLDAFNKFVRKDVAETLKRLQLRSEAVVHGVVFIICTTVDGCIAILCFMMAEILKPAAWPDAVIDVVEILSPAICLIDKFPHLAQCTNSSGLHLKFDHVHCFNSSIVALPDAPTVDCDGLFDSDGLKTVAVICGIYAAVSIIFSCHAIVWSRWWSIYYNPPSTTTAVLSDGTVLGGNGKPIGKLDVDKNGSAKLDVDENGNAKLNDDGKPTWATTVVGPGGKEVGIIIPGGSLKTAGAAKIRGSAAKYAPRSGAPVSV